MTALAKRNSYVPKKKINIQVKTDLNEQEKKDWAAD